MSAQAMQCCSVDVGWLPGNCDQEFSRVWGGITYYCCAVALRAGKKKKIRRPGKGLSRQPPGTLDLPGCITWRAWSDAETPKAVLDREHERVTLLLLSVGCFCDVSALPTPVVCLSSIVHVVVSRVCPPSHGMWSEQGSVGWSDAGTARRCRDADGSSVRHCCVAFMQ